MADLRKLNDVLLHELKDIYSAETQILQALPKMEGKAQSEALQEAFRSHLEETKGQLQRLEDIAGILGTKLSGKTCKAMKGLIEEGSEILREDSENVSLIDALLISAAQRIEHYEISAYGTARAIAEHLGEDQIAALLQETLDEEASADEKLSLLSEEEILPDACIASDEMQDRNSSDEPMRR